MKPAIKPILFSFLLLFSAKSYSQTAPFEISIEPMSITGLSGLQSYAFGQYDGKWLIVGGRLDGLHRRQPWAAFDVAGHNTQIFVVDPISEETWTAALSSLPTSIQEQLSSTNMEFIQVGDYLYCAGGYGYSPTENDHTTFPNLTAINVPDVIDAVISNTDFTPAFRQITDSEFQVTGGHLSKIDGIYYLLGGQKFIGRYNPMGPDHGPGFIQEYTDAIRMFTLEDDGTTITVNHLTSYIDADNLHRRDYNATHQILPDGNEGVTMFSGVFNPTNDLPFLNSVTVDSDGYAVNNDFEQFYNHYHCPVLPIYSESDNEMHNVFFGGIAQFYDNDGTLVQDYNVPFVNTIARVSRDANGVMAEYKLPIEMPTLLGAGAEFISVSDFPQFPNGVFKLDSVTTDSTLIGYIFGGISSSAPNIFFTNDGTQSEANNQIFKVYIRKPLATSIDKLNGASISALNLKVYPNPNDGILNISFILPNADDVTISIRDAKGILIEETLLKNLSKGENVYTKNIDNLTNGSVYLITLETSEEHITQKLIVEQ